MTAERSYTHAPGERTEGAMGLRAWAAILASHRRAMGLVGLLVAFTGLSMLLNPTHAAGLSWLGSVLVALGVLLFAIFVWPTIAEVVAPRSLGARLIYRLTWRARLVPYFPVIGAALAIIDLAYNVLFSATPALQTEDLMVQLSAGVLVIYRLVPRRFERERDFVLLFFLFLDSLLVMPLLVARVASQNVDASVDVYSWIALAPQVGAVLSLFGVTNTVHAVAGSTAPGLTFTPLHVYTPVTLVITTACSGIYSFGIFAAGYVSFLVTEYARPSRKLWLLIGLGFAASYAANVLRMVVIVLVGYYTDTMSSDLQNLLLAHSYAGWIIFLAWLALFWGILFRFLPIEEYGTLTTRHAVALAPSRLRTGKCSICWTALSPAIPATRCECGAYTHRACLASAHECPACHRKVAPHPTGVADGN